MIPKAVILYGYDCVYKIFWHLRIGDPYAVIRAVYTLVLDFDRSSYAVFTILIIHVVYTGRGIRSRGRKHTCVYIRIHIILYIKGKGGSYYYSADKADEKKGKEYIQDIRKCFIKNPACDGKCRFRVLFPIGSVCLTTPFEIFIIRHCTILSVLFLSVVIEISRKLIIVHLFEYFINSDK